MFVPINSITYSLTVLKSTFIAVVMPFDNIDDLETKLSEIKDAYPKARHYLYAYQVGDKVRYHDDNEPNAIAKNFLSVISKRDINNILVIVVRYFGGIKLGASRLSRTYLDTFIGALDRLNFGEEKIVNQYQVKVNYQIFNKLKSYNYQLEDIRFNEMVYCSIISSNDILNKLEELKISNIKINKIKKIIQSTNRQ